VSLRPETDVMTRDWQAFVREYGGRARVRDLVAVIGQSREAITAARQAGCRRLPQPLDFAALFTAWHGRPPADTDWPAPVKSRGGRYEWSTPESALLASLVGQMGPVEMAQILTARLQQVTGDPDAQRSRTSVQVAVNRIGLQMGDVVGGLSVSAAAREVGSRSILDHEIRAGRLTVRRVGRLLVIPYEEWARWKGTRVFPPKGFIKLALLRKALGIRSDKLSEWARHGWVPSAIRCNPSGTGEKNTQWGTWYVDPKVAKKLLADRRAGRPMPWWGKGEIGNLQVTFRRWQQRQHPARCAACQAIWGPAGAPTTFEAYVERYRPLAHGAKRHLTMLYSDGVTLHALAAEAHQTTFAVRLAITNGVLRATRVGRVWYITRTDATRWIGRHCPSGDREMSWVALPTAVSRYGFTLQELRQHIAAGELRSRVGEDGPQAGVTYVLRQQCRELRDTIGYTEATAAARVGVSVARLRVLLRGLEWRPAPRIPAEVVGNAIKRQASHHGWTVAQAATVVKRSAAWVHQQILNGTIRPSRTPWDRRRRYVSAPMLRRLQKAAAQRQAPPTRVTAEWLLLGPACHLAGVSSGTLVKWTRDGGVQTRESLQGTRWHRRSVMARATTYWVWAMRRYKRATAPAWFQPEVAA